MAWEHFAHEADMGIRGIGDSKAEAFEQAAVALTAVMTSPENVRATHQVRITCEAPDDELLFAEWLNALIYEMSTRKMVFGRFRVTLLPGRIDATFGENLSTSVVTSPRSRSKAQPTRRCPSARLRRAMDGTMCRGRLSRALRWTFPD
jgi:SHS2 domain-containing protein